MKPAPTMYNELVLANSARHPGMKYDQVRTLTASENPALYREVLNYARLQADIVRVTDQLNRRRRTVLANAEDKRAAIRKAAQKLMKESRYSFDDAWKYAKRENETLVNEDAAAKDEVKKLPITTELLLKPFHVGQLHYGTYDNDDEVSAGLAAAAPDFARFQQPNPEVLFQAISDSGVLKACDTHGLPRRGFYFERGVWEKSKLLKGASTAGPLSWGETEQGLREFGLEFKHSNLPRSKPVERVIGALQNLMEGLPGYCGRNEQVEKFERFQKLKREVENRKLDPAGHFFTEDQWAGKLEELCHAYNADVQQGKMTGGLSPDEAFAKYAKTDDPPVKFPPQCRYLLAHHKRPARVTTNGITLTFGKNRYNYRNTETGKLIGREVLTWFDPETPDVLAVTDMHRNNPFCVERSADVPAMSADDAAMAAEQERIGQHHKPILARYRILAARHRPQFRHFITDAETVERGATFDRARAEIDHNRNEGERQAPPCARPCGKPAFPFHPPACKTRTVPTNCGNSPNGFPPERITSEQYAPCRARRPVQSGTLRQQRRE